MPTAPARGQSARPSGTPGHPTRASSTPPSWTPSARPLCPPRARGQFAGTWTSMTSSGAPQRHSGAGHTEESPCGARQSTKLSPTASRPGRTGQGWVLRTHSSPVLSAPAASPAWSSNTHSSRADQGGRPSAPGLAAAPRQTSGRPGPVQLLSPSGSMRPKAISWRSMGLLHPRQRPHGAAMRGPSVPSIPMSSAMKPHGGLAPFL